MPDLRLSIAVLLIAVTAICFLGSMLRFFRADRGSMAGRVTLVVSILAGIAAILITVLRKDGVDSRAFLAGSALILAAQVIFWFAVAAHGRNRPAAAFSNEAPDTLVVRGVYRWIRHPFYVAYLAAFAGGALHTEMIAMQLVPLWLGVLYARAALQEERIILGSPLAGPYRAYMQRTGAFVPKIGALSTRGA